MKRKRKFMCEVHGPFWAYPKTDKNGVHASCTHCEAESRRAAENVRAGLPSNAHKTPAKPSAQNRDGIPF